MYSLPLLLFICAYFSTFANLVYMPFSIFSTEQDIKFVSSFSVYLQFSETAIYYVMSISYDLKLLMSAHAIFCFVLLQIKKLGQSYLFMQFFFIINLFFIKFKKIYVSVLECTYKSQYPWSPQLLDQKCSSLSMRHKVVSSLLLQVLPQPSKCWIIAVCHCIWLLFVLEKVHFLTYPPLTQLKSKYSQRIVF